MIEDVRARLQQQATEQLSSLLRGVGREIDAVVDIRFGMVFVEIIREVLRSRHDLVIKTVGEGGAHSFLFGGTDQHLLRKCPCPVWILAGETSANYRHILAAVDFDPWEEGDEENNVEDALNRQIIGLAASLAASDFAQLHVVHAWQSIADIIVPIFSSYLSEEKTAANRKKEQREHQSRLHLLGNGLEEQFGSDVYRYLSPRFHLREGNARCDTCHGHRAGGGPGGHGYGQPHRHPVIADRQHCRSHPEQPRVLVAGGQTGRLRHPGHTRLERGR